MFSGCPFVCLSSHLSVTKLVNVIFKKQVTNFDANWHKWFTGQKRENINFEVWGQRSRGRIIKNPFQGDFSRTV